MGQGRRISSIGLAHSESGFPGGSAVARPHGRYIGWMLPVLCVTLLLVAARPGQAQDPDAATVRAGSRALFVLQGSLGSLTARERAEIVNRRIDRILHDPSLNPREVRVARLADGSLGVVLGELQIIEVTRADLEPGQLPEEAVAAEWAESLRASLTQLQPLFGRERRRPGVKSLSEHHILLLIVQVALLLLVARTCGELALRLRQPPVIGQLLAGILLGQSFLGALLPDVKALVFPVEATQSYLLEVISWLGVLFLLLLTGLETDVALIRQQGRAAAHASVWGVLWPFAAGLGLGFVIPDSLLVTPQSRLVAALFLGTVLSVSSVPVIAKILSDMRLLRRNVGQLIVAAALAHDTASWLILGVVASLAAGGKIQPLMLGKTLGGTVLFLAACILIGRPVIPRVLRWINDSVRVDHAVLTAIIVLMLLGAAATQFIGVHAVLGAFAVGVLLRESPVVNTRVLHPIETVTTAIFAPIFFAAAGLHVDLAIFARVEVTLVALVLTVVAALTKIAGCYAGARFAGASHWASLSVGVGVNARGAMGLIVGILGFSLGILTIELYSVIILMALLTTAMTPPLLRMTLARIETDPTEEARLLREEIQERGTLAGVRRVLLPARGGENARLAAELLGSLGTHQQLEVTTLTVSPPGGDADAREVHEEIRSSLGSRVQFHPMTLVTGDAPGAILGEAAKGYDLLAIGCGPDAGERAAVFGRVADAVARAAPLPMLIVRRGRRAAREVRTILAPISGGPSSAATELAIALAAAWGARVVALTVCRELDESYTWFADHEAAAQESARESIRQVESLGRAYGVEVEGVILRAQHPGPAIASAAGAAEADLIIGGGTLRTGPHLYMGATLEAVLRESECSVALLLGRGPGLGGRTSG